MRVLHFKWLLWLLCRFTAYLSHLLTVSVGHANTVRTVSAWIRKILFEVIPNGQPLSYKTGNKLALHYWSRLHFGHSRLQFSSNFQSLRRLPGPLTTLRANYTSSVIKPVFIDTMSKEDPIGQETLKNFCHTPFWIFLTVSEPSSKMTVKKLQLPETSWRVVHTFKTSRNFPYNEMPFASIYSPSKST